MGIKFEDHFPNVDVIERFGMPSVEAILAAARLCWTGHLVCMTENPIRIVKTIFYSELTEGKRKHGGQKLHYKVILKHDLKQMDIPADSWKLRALAPVQCVTRPFVQELHLLHAPDTDMDFLAILVIIVLTDCY